MYSDGCTSVNLPVDEARRGSKVLFADREEYVSKAIQVRLNEGISQCEALRRGIAKIIPESLTNTVPHSELQVLVCGRTYIDVDLLTKVAAYEGKGADSGEKYGPDHPTIVHFW